MPIMRGDWAEALGPGLNLNTFKFRKLQSFYNMINNIRTSTKAYEDDFVVAGFGPLVKKTELGPTTLDEPIKIGGMRFIHNTFGLAYLISHEMRRDNQYPQMWDLAAELGNSAYWTTELYGHDVWNNAFDTTKYSGRDGLALFSTVHPIQGTGGTKANKPAVDTDLSEAALEAAMTAFRTQVNYRGMPIGNGARQLLIHPANVYQARILLQSAGFPQIGPDNAINPIKQDNLSVIGGDGDPWILDEDQWILLGDSGDIDVRFYWREQFDTATWDDMGARGTYHGGWQSHSNGFADWRNTYGSPGA